MLFENCELILKLKVIFILTEKRVICSTLPLKLAKGIIPRQCISSKMITRSNIYDKKSFCKGLGFRLLVCYPTVLRLDTG